MDLKLPETKILVAETLNEPDVRPSVWCSMVSGNHRNLLMVRQLSQQSFVAWRVWLSQALISRFGCLWKAGTASSNGVGNGALAGGINYPAMAAPLSKGYAVMSTDTGHQSESPVDGAWMLGHPDCGTTLAIAEMHMSTRNAKAITEAYYDKAPSIRTTRDVPAADNRVWLRRRGTRPTMMASPLARRPTSHPHVARRDISRLGGVQGEDSESLGGPPGPPTVTPKLALLHEAALAACDDKDGVKDGVINDPPSCDFDPATLLCPDNPEDPNTCLTQAEIDTSQRSMPV